MTFTIPVELLRAYSLTVGIVFVVVLLACVFHARHNQITLLSLGVRWMYYVARYTTNLAKQSDEFLIHWRKHVKDNPIVPANENRPKIVRTWPKEEAQ